jgi:hypothetical protein
LRRLKAAQRRLRRLDRGGWAGSNRRRRPPPLLLLLLMVVVVAAALVPRLLAVLEGPGRGLLLLP